MPRYIDADALTEKLSSFSMTITRFRSGKGILFYWIMVYLKKILQIVNEAPTIEAEPVRHGEWIDGKPFTNSRWKVCSECHRSAPCPNGGENYCPNCGAKMDGGTEG